MRCVDSAGPRDGPSLYGPNKILAVDDSPTYLQALIEALRQESYDVIAATSGAEALELMTVQPVDCVLLDLVMPGLAGTRRAGASKRRRPGVEFPSSC